MTTWRGLYWVAALGLALRLAYALASQTIHHPDELFQYLEQAHRLVFGYGLIPWEYRFGTRSWLLPLSISAPLFLCKLLHVDDPAVYVPLVKSLFCMLSVSLVFSTYRIAKALVSEAAGRLAALFACLWYELIYFAPRPLPDVVATYFLMGALACVAAPGGRGRAFLFGFSAAAAVALRLQYAPLAGLLLLLAAITWRPRAILWSAAAALGVALLTGYLDQLAWGTWFVSYYNNYLFNATREVSTLFATQRHSLYVLQLGVASAGLFLITALLGLRFARRLWILLVWVLVVVGTHSAIPHKEYRFVFAAIPVLLVMMAAVTILAAEGLGSPARAAWAPRVALASVAVVSLVGMAGLLPRQDAVYPVRPLYAHAAELEAFAFLGDQTDLAGVLLSNVPWAESGAYYHLHRDVPLYFSPDEYIAHDSDGLGLLPYASHLVAATSARDVPGFSRVARFGRLDVWRRREPRASYPTLPSYSRHLPQLAIDGTYEPSVRPRF